MLLQDRRQAKLAALLRTGSVRAAPPVRSATRLRAVSENDPQPAAPRPNAAAANLSVE